MPKGHSGSHYNNLSFLQLLVSCSVVKFNLRRVNRIFPPNASLLTIINLLLSTKRALLGNEIQDPLKTSGKHRGLLCVQHLFRLHICLSARVHLQSWAASCRNSATCLFFLPIATDKRSIPDRNVHFLEFLASCRTGIFFEGCVWGLYRWIVAVVSHPAIPLPSFLHPLTFPFVSFDMTFPVQLWNHTVATPGTHSRGCWLCNRERKKIFCHWGEHWAFLHSAKNEMGKEWG